MYVLRFVGQGSRPAKGETNALVTGMGRGKGLGGGMLGSGWGEMEGVGRGKGLGGRGCSEVDEEGGVERLGRGKGREGRGCGEVDWGEGEGIGGLRKSSSQG